MNDAEVLTLDSHDAETDVVVAAFGFEAEAEAGVPRVASSGPPWQIAGVDHAKKCSRGSSGAELRRGIIGTALSRPRRRRRRLPPRRHTDTHRARSADAQHRIPPLDQR